MSDSIKIQNEKVSDYSVPSSDRCHVLGHGSLTQRENGLLLEGEVLLIDSALLVKENQEVEYVFESLNDNGGVGFVFRANDKWVQSIANVDSAKQLYDTSVWNYEKLHFPFGNKLQLTSPLSFIKSKKSVHILEDGTPLLMRNGIEQVFKLRVSGNVVTLCEDGLVMFEKTIQNVKAQNGYIGISLKKDGKILLKSITTRDVLHIEGSSRTQCITLRRKSICVNVDKEFPRIISYELNGQRLPGCSHVDDTVRIDGTSYSSSAALVESNENSAVYRVIVASLNIHFYVSIAIEEDERVRVRLFDIDDTSHPVISIGLCAPLLSVMQEPHSHAVYSTGSHDCHFNLGAGEKPEGLVRCTIPIVHTSLVAASMYNSVISNLTEFECYEYRDGCSSSICFGSSDFVYRSIDRKEIVCDDLYTDIVLTEDANGDGKVDWQDAACALRGIIPPIISKAQFSNAFLHMSHNFASGIQQPFLKMADNLVRFANLTDRFPQALLIKGYASEGHDSGHCDYGDISTRAGGEKDFASLLDVAHECNAIVGVHINHTEAYPEAQMYSNELVSTKKGWLWLDQSCYLRREADIASGQMQKRIDRLFDKASELDFIYVDTYRDERHNAARLAQEITKKHKALLATEEGGRLVKWVFWTHWPVFGDGIHRFVYHTSKDIYKSSPLLRGGYERNGTDGFMGWGGGNDIYQCLSGFFTKQLPQKYLMLFNLLRITDNEAFFEGGVRSCSVNSVNQIFKNDKLVANGDLIFIPWADEKKDNTDKIYHWNPKGGKTTWSLPDEWQNTTQVKCYLCEQTGKKLVATLPVVSGEITIDAIAQTPYVLYHDEAPQSLMDWSVGSLIKDAGFNCRDFTVWEKEKEELPGSIFYEDDKNGVSMLTLQGSGTCRVTQSIQGLTVGKRYRIGVWACAAGEKEAIISAQYGEEVIASNCAKNIKRKCKIVCHYAFDKLARYLTVDFVAKKSCVNVVLSSSAYDGMVQFFDSRLVESDPLPLPKDAVAFEDFEDAFSPYGIFVPKKECSFSHLSTTHSPYTKDTISGKYSLKAVVPFSTTPSSVVLCENSTYKITFSTIGNGALKVSSDSKGKIVFKTSFKSGKNEFVFSTKKQKDCVVEFRGKKRVSDKARLILDDVIITKC